MEEKTLSRQRRWAIKNQAKGRCPICGKKCAPAFRCKKHAKAQKKINQEYRQKLKEGKG